MYTLPSNLKLSCLVRVMIDIDGIRSTFFIESELEVAVGIGHQRPCFANTSSLIS